VTPADRPAILEGRDIVLSVRGKPILDLEHVEVRSGEILAILGPNGAGKSTLLRVLAMLQQPDSGSVTFHGRKGREADRLLRECSAFVFQRPHLWAGSVSHNLELGLKLGRRSARGQREERGQQENARRAAAQLGIEPLLDRDARALSGGETQRVAIARALALDQEILFLDEPASNLDAMARTALIEDLDRLARDGRHTTVIATHDRADAFSLADRVIVMRDGRSVQSGHPEDLFENPVDPFIAAVTGAELAFRATVEASDEGLLRIRVGSGTLSAVGAAAPGERVRVVYRPEELFVSRARIEASPRNRFQARVTEIRQAGSLERVRLEGGGHHWVAVITRAAAAELALEVGTEIWVQVKAPALHAFPG
jgi:molybdopterin-binding protein